jgi:hypothetical protein
MTQTLDLEWVAETSRAFVFDAIDIFFRTSRREAGHLLVAYPEPIEMTEIEPEPGILPEPRLPALRITRESAQLLADTLWNAGIKPTEIEKQTHPQTISAMSQQIATLKDEINWQRSFIGWVQRQLEDTGEQDLMYALYNRYCNHLEEEVRNEVTHQPSCTVEDIANFLGSLRQGDLGPSETKEKK